MTMQPQKAMRIEVDDLTQLEGVMLAAYERELQRQLNDPCRLESLYGSQFMDAEWVHKIEGIVASAAQLLGCPNASITMVMQDSTDFLAIYGNEQSPRATQDTYCQHVVGTRRMLVVNDALKHNLLCTSVAATEWGVRAYLGIPLVRGLERLVIGVFCVSDVKARKWTPADVVILTNLAAVVSRIEQVG